MRLSQIADYAIHKHLAEESVLLYTPSQILNYVEHLQWILPGWLHSTGQLVISSGPGIGKTSLMLQLAACITTGERFLGIQALIKPRIFFMSLEMDNHGLKYILEHQQREWSNTPEFLILDESTSLTAYENLIAENEFSLVIIDSLSELTDDDDDNQGREAKRIMKWCKKIRRRYNCAIIIIHHNRKANTGNKKPKSLDDLAGSLHFGRSTDTVLQLWEVASHYIELSGVKVRYGTKDAFFIRRNENIWYSRDAGNETRTARTNPPRDNPKPSSSDRHGDELHRPTSGTPSLGFGYNDKPK
jgi:RecA-family ATPase